MTLLQNSGKLSRLALSSKRSRLIHSERETAGEDRTRPPAAAEVVVALLEAAIAIVDTAVKTSTEGAHRGNGK